uniref:Uncharacterized protein n=1 Tax=Oryza punctata TaxID=4537 RepID=A0A0E0KF35_ORYPU
MEHLYLQANGSAATSSVVARSGLQELRSGQIHRRELEGAPSTSLLDVPTGHRTSIAPSASTSPWTASRRELGVGSGHPELRNDQIHAATKGP